MAMPEIKKPWSHRWWALLVFIGILAGLAFVFTVAYAVLERLESAKLAFIERNRTTFSSFGSSPDVRSIIETSDDPALGATNASIVIVEFSDFQCPFCRQAYPIVKTIMREYGDRVKFIYRDFPVTQTHPDALNAAMAGGCAHEAGLFWEYHDHLFDHQSDISIDALKQYAFAVGIPTAPFAECLDSQRFRNEALNDLEEGIRLGVTGTPTFFINGARVPGVIPLDTFRKIIDQLLLQTP